MGRRTGHRHGVPSLALAISAVIVVTTSSVFGAAPASALALRLDPSMQALVPAADGAPSLVWQEMPTTSRSQFPGCSAAAYDDAARAPICVGQSSTTNYTSVWEYNGENWTNVTPAGAQPAGRGLGPLVTDGENEMELFPVIGSNGTVQTWGFSAKGWVELPTIGVPPPMMDPAMAYDPIDGYAVLFGGCVEGPLSCPPENWTWTFFGENWTNVSRTAGPAPSPREGASFVADPLERHLVLFGGTSNGSNGTNDTWTFAVGIWRSLTFVGQRTPAPRFSECAGYDTTLGSTVVANGWDLGAPRYDTWLLNASGWTEDTSAGILDGTCSGYTTVFDVRDNYLLALVDPPDSPGRLLNETWVLAPPTPAPSSGIPWTTVAIIAIPVTGAVVFFLAVFSLRRREKSPRQEPPTSP